jgi:hypothetical protein
MLNWAEMLQIVPNEPQMSKLSFLLASALGPSLTLLAKKKSATGNLF